MSRLKNCDLGKKKKENTLHSFRLLHKRVELSIFFFFENFGFAVDEWWYNNYNNKNISIYIAAFARGCKALLPIITVSGKLSQPASQSYSFTEGCYWPSEHLILAYFPWPIAPWCAQVDEAIEINASFRLAWRCRYAAWSSLAVSEFQLSAATPLWFYHRTASRVNCLRSAAVGKAAGLLIYWQDAAYRLVFPLRLQVALAQFYKNHHRSSNTASGKLVWKQHKYLAQGHKHVGTSGARTHGLVILSPAIELIYWDVAALRYVFFTQQGQALWQIDLWWNFTIFFSFIFNFQCIKIIFLFFFCTVNSNVRFLILLVCFLFCFCFLVFVYIFIYLLILHFNFFF